MPMPEYLSPGGDPATLQRAAFEERLVKKALAHIGDPGLERELRDRLEEVTGARGLRFAQLRETYPDWYPEVRAAVLEDPRLPDPLLDLTGKAFRRCPAAKELETVIEELGDAVSTTVAVAFRRGHADAVLYTTTDPGGPATPPVPHVAYRREAEPNALVYLVAWKSFLNLILPLSDSGLSDTDYSE